MVKKWISFVLCVAMIAMVLVLPATAETEDEVKIALCIANTLGDRSFFDSAHEGLMELEEDYGIIASVVECKSDASAFEPALVEAGETNDIVVAVGWEFWTPLENVVPQMPDTKFIFIDNGMDGMGDNLVSVIFADNEGSFLAGYIAMKQSQTATVGVVGGGDDETINNFIVGYKQGALYANPEGTVLDPIYTNHDYDSPDKGKEAALALYGRGADVVFHVAGKTGLGVFEAAKETQNYAIGVDGDQKYLNPDVILCSMMKNVGASISSVIGMYLVDGIFEGGQILNMDMSSEMVDVVYGDDSMPQQISPELKAEVEELKQKIIAGEIVVESTR